MSGDDDTELRDILVQTLERNGALAKIRAQLRASVFLALDEQDNVKHKTPLLNEKAKRFCDTETGRLCAQVVAEFLESLNLDATLSVFLSEIQMGDRPSKANLTKSLNLSKNIDGQEALLKAILERNRNNFSETNHENEKNIAVTKSTTTDKKTAAEPFGFSAGSAGGNKSSERENDSDDDDDDFFGGKKNFRINAELEKGYIPSTVTVRAKSNIGLNDAGEENAKKKNGAKSGSLLGELPPMPSLGKSPLPSLSKEKSQKDADFMKILGGSLDEVGSDSPKESPKVPGLDLKKLQPNKDDAKNKKATDSVIEEKSKPVPGKGKEAAVKSSRDPSIDEDISEEIAEDLDVDTLLNSNRSSNASSF